MQYACGCVEDVLERGVGPDLSGIPVRHGASAVYLVQYHGLEPGQGKAAVGEEAACLIVPVSYHSEDQMLGGDAHPPGPDGFLAGIFKYFVQYIEFAHKSLQFGGTKIIIF